jgi:hypothetical protein
MNTVKTFAYSRLETNDTDGNPPKYDFYFCVFTTVYVFWDLLKRFSYLYTIGPMKPFDFIQFEN